MRRVVLALAAGLLAVSAPACLHGEGPAPRATVIAAPVALTYAEAQATPVRMTASMPATFDVVLASRTTRYVRFGEMRGRAHNVEKLAARRLDLAVIPPGGTLSFNEAVGSRNRRDGYRTAPVLEAGELVDGVGGGVCQVASTLHVAALHAGLDAIEHSVHSRPSSYLGLGLDAAVAWPNGDLVLSNPHSFPVLVHAVAERGVVRVELRGSAPAPEVRISVDADVIPFVEIVEQDPTLPRGQTVVVAEGRNGHRVRRTRTIGARIETVSFRYPQQDRYVRIGTGIAEWPVVAPATAPVPAPSLPAAL